MTTNREPLLQMFLRVIWSFQPPGFCFLSRKDWITGEWHEFNLTTYPFGLIERDLYFCPNTFTDPRRLRKNASHGRWLYADLDEVGPAELSACPPTVIWETSPRRFQAMWLLDRPIHPRRLEDLNQRMTYFTGADRGGWSLTKVLRVPGSVSTKYGEDAPFRVQPISGFARNVYAVPDIQALLRDVVTSRTSSAPPTELPNPLPDRDAVLTVHHIPPRGRALIRTETLVRGDDRSLRLWELEGILLDAGLTPAEVLVVVRDTIWNKYRKQRRELTILWNEIHKCLAARRLISTPSPTAAESAESVESAESATPKSPLLPNTLPHLTFMQAEFPKPEWLIQDVWRMRSPGYIAGEYKSFKSMLALEMAVSVASGRPFLDKYAVNQSAAGTPVLYIHEEGQPGAIQDRVENILIRQGLLAKHPTRTTDPATVEIELGVDRRMKSFQDLPIYYTSLVGLDLTDEDDQERILTHVAHLRPSLVIFETFYLLAGVLTEENIGEIAPVLRFLTRIASEFGTAVIISHHMHKSTEEKRLGNRVSGSNIWNRWYESAIYTQRKGEEEDNLVRMEAHHREGGVIREVIRFRWGAEYDDYAIEFVDPTDDDAVNHIVDMGKPELAGLTRIPDSDFRPKYATTSNGLLIELDLADLPVDATPEQVMANQSDPFWAEDISRACGLGSSSVPVAIAHREGGYKVVSELRKGTTTTGKRVSHNKRRIYPVADDES